jgi:hypothetical protein
VGNVKVTISSVTGNIVTGTFSGVNNTGKGILNGKFSCRVKNYQPQTDSVNKWQFGLDEHIFLYNLYGGNVLNAGLSQNAGRYLLTVNGESDNGSSTFKMVLSSNSPLTTGVYQTKDIFNSPGLTIDSLYFRSQTRIWNGNTTYFSTEDFSQFPAYCRIDAIDANGVTGTLYGKIIIFLNSGSITSAYMRAGKFRASFY